MANVSEAAGLPLRFPTSSALPGGQSGNLLSPHYDDLFALGQRGKGVPIAWTREEIRQAMVETLELIPE